MDSALKDILAGTMGGIAQVAVGQPLDLVKVRLATQNHLNPQYRGLADCFMKTLRAEGVTGLYKGAASPLTGAMFFNAVLFCSFGEATKRLGAKNADDLSIAGVAAAGSVSGVCGMLIETPMDLFKTKMQTQIGKDGGAHKSTLAAARATLKQHGIRGCYQGGLITVLRNLPSNAFYFLGFEAVKRSLTPDGQQPSLATCFVAGGVGGFGYWGLSYPLDVLKTRIQAQPCDRAARAYSGILDCARKTFRAEGVAGLFRGYSAACVRGVVVNAFIFTTVVATKRMMN